MATSPPADWTPTPPPADNAAALPPAGAGRHNVWLLLGSLIVIGVLGLAVFGPILAPQDPLETRLISRVEGQWISPPYPPFTVPDRPLGSDALGRDLLSRLLWALRPSLLTVLFVAGIRLALGTGLGLAAGWLEGRAGDGLHSLIAAALAIPVLIVALAAIAALNLAIGAWAFVIGLVATGWAETARLVAAQTRAVKGQTYIEAARALGSDSREILSGHVLRQVAPMLWMLLAFETSNTLLATATLGFLGYYLGGDVWVPVEDAWGMRVSAMPDLGQLLAGTSQVYTDPWGVAAAGMLVFLVVLGFNLLGEGLRLEANPERVRRRTRVSRAAERAGVWIDEHVVAPAAARAQIPLARVTLAVAAVALVAGAVVWWRLQAPPPPEAQLVVPGGHLWAAARHDAQGTLWTPAIGPAGGTVQWVFTDTQGLIGGPAVAADGTVYVVGPETLYALDPSGRTRWQATLPVAPIAGPALGPGGEVYVVEAEGGLYAYDPNGEARWWFRQPARVSGTTGPIVAPDGTIFYVAGGDRLQAISPEGTLRWATATGVTLESYTPPRLSPSGAWLFLQGASVRVRDGSLQTIQPLKGKERFFLGGDGRYYYRLTNDVTVWLPGDDGAVIGRTTTWEYGRYSIGAVRDVGATRDQVIWLLYYSMFDDARIVWLRMNGRVVAMAHFPHRDTHVIGVGGDGTMYLCGVDRETGPECLSFKDGSGDPAWRLPLDRGGVTVVGGAVVPGRLYVAMREGYLYAIGGD